MSDIFSHLPAASDSGGLLCMGPSVGKEVKKKRKEWFEQKQPWQKQKLNRSSNGWVGVSIKDGESISVNADIPKQIKSLSLYEQLYLMNVPKSDSHKMIGKWWSAADAVVLLQEAEKLQHTCPGHGINHPNPPPSLKPADELFFADEKEIVWARGSGCYCPRAGVMNRGQWDSEEGRRLNQPVTDFRYSNAISQNKSVVLPSSVSFARKVQRHNELAKHDCKNGFHLFDCDPVHRHLMAVHWRGFVLCYTCAAFGIRSAPDCFTVYN